MKQTEGQAASRLLPKDDTILVAWVFSLLLHLPLLVGIGVFVGGERQQGFRDITGMIESAGMRSLAASETFDMPVLEETHSEVVSRMSSGPSTPSLCGLTETGSLSDREDVLGGLEPSPSGPVPLASMKIPDREVARRWGRWYSGEVRRLVQSFFPHKALLRRKISGKVVFRLQLAPDGSIERFELLQSEHPALSEAAKIAVRHACPFPPYGSLGLDFFPPFDLTVRVVP